MSNRFTLYAVKVGTTVLAGINARSFRQQGNVLVPVTDGGPDPTVAVLESQTPIIEFTTLDFDAALTALGALGTDLADLTGGVILYFAKMGPVARTGAGTHITLTATAGFICLSRISAVEGQPASLSFMVYAQSSDGFAAPWTKAINGSLATIATPLGKIYTIGPAVLNGTALNRTKGIDLDMSVQAVQDRDGGKPYPTFVCLQQRTPKVTLRHVEAAFAVPATFSSAVFFLRACINGTTPAADASEEHVKLTLAAGVYDEDGINNSGFVDESTLMIHGAKTGSTDIVQYALDQAVA